MNPYYLDPKNWTIDPAKTKVFVTTYPSRMLTFELAFWLSMRFPPNNIQIVNIKGVERARNKIVRDYILRTDPNQYTDFIFCDNDIRPTINSDFFLELDTDLAACRYDTNLCQAWANPIAFHMGLARIRRKVFETIPAPWFMNQFTPDGCEYSTCDCLHFLTKATEAGFTSSHAGWAAHDGLSSWAHGNSKPVSHAEDQ